MFVEGRDEEGKTVWLQLVKRNDRWYLRRASKNSLNIDERSPRQKEFLRLVTGIWASAYNSRKTGLLPPTAEKLKGRGDELISANRYPYTEPPCVRKQETLWKRVSEESKRQIETYQGVYEVMPMVMMKRGEREKAMRPPLRLSVD